MLVEPYENQEANRTLGFAEDLEGEYFARLVGYRVGGSHEAHPGKGTCHAELLVDCVTVILDPSKILSGETRVPTNLCQGS